MSDSSAVDVKLQLSAPVVLASLQIVADRMLIRFLFFLLVYIA